MNDHGNPFELKVGGPDGIDNADVPVRWCITPEFVTQMDRDGVVDPHVLLVSVHPLHGEMSRHLAPVGNLMTYVRFHYAGEMRIFGWIVNGEDGRKKLHHDYMQRTEGNWNTTLVGYGLQPATVKRAYQGTVRRVSIPADVFGKEPPRWLKWYANLWHSDRPTDQCQFRRRMLIGIPKAIPFVAWAVLATALKVFIGSLFALGGFPHSVQWRYAWRPYEYPMPMILNDDTTKSPGRKNRNHERQNGVQLDHPEWWLGQRFLWWRRNREGDNIIGLFFLPFTPLIVLTIFSCAWAATGFIGDAAIYTIAWLKVLLAITFVIDLVIGMLQLGIEYGPTAKRFVMDSMVGYPIRSIGQRWHALDMYLAETNQWPLVLVTFFTLVVSLSVYVIAITWFVLGWFYLLVAFLGTVYYLNVRIFDWADARALDRNDPTMMRELLCAKDPMNMVASYNAVPWQQRSFTLAYKTIKNKVCKPMQY